MDKFKIRSEGNNNIKSDDKINNNRNKDVKKLKEMCNIINDYQIDMINLKQCLWHIGRLSGGITVNGEIWKKYGYVQLDNKVNKDGIPFEKLSHLKNIINDKQILSMITSDEYNHIKGDMNGLKNKLYYILKSELCFNEDVTFNYSNCDFSVSIPDILSFSDQYFEILTAKLISKEVNFWGKIDFNIKEDRYFIGRSLCKIGEFLNDYIKGKKLSENNKNKRDYIFKAFKNLIETRNTLVHNCEIIIEGMKDLNGDINQLISDIQVHLEYVFCQRLDIDPQFRVDYHYDDGKKFEEDSGKLLKYLSGKFLSAEDHKMVLNKLISEVCEIFKDAKIAKEELDAKNFNQKRNKIKNILKQKNKKYQSHFLELDESSIINYPKVLSLDAEDEIIRKEEILRNCGSEANDEIRLETNNKESDPPNTKNKEFSKLFTKKDYYNIWISEIKYFQYILNHSHVNILYYIYDSLIHENIMMTLKLKKDALKRFHEVRYNMQKKENENSEKIQLIIFESDRLKTFIQRSSFEYEQVNEAFKRRYPTFYTEWKASRQNKIYKDFQQKIECLFQERYEFQKKENDLTIEYYENELWLLIFDFIETELTPYPELKKYDYISQQAVVHMQQMIIDTDSFYDSLGKIEDSVIDKEDYDRIFSCFNKYVTSRFMDRQIHLCKGYRTSGLSHRILSFNRDIFRLDAIRDTVRFSDYLNCLYRILTTKKISTVKEFYDMGRDLYEICSRKESIKYLERALQRAESHPEEVETHHWDQDYMIIFGKPRMICEINTYLADNYRLSFQNEDMNRKVNEIISNINLEELMKCNIPEIKGRASVYYFLIGEYVLLYQQDYAQALDLFNKADSLCEDNRYKRHIAGVYFDLKEYDKTRELCKIMLDNDDYPEEKVFAASLLLSCSSDDPKVVDSKEESRRSLDKMQFYYKTGRQYLKSRMRENYHGMDLILLNRKLALMISENDRYGMNESRLKELVEIEEQFDFIMDQYDEVIWRGLAAILCILLCKLCTQVYTCGDLTLRKDDEHLNKARKYFIIALEGQDSLLKLPGNVALQCYEETAVVLITTYIDYTKRYTKQIDSAFLHDLLSKFEKTNPDLCHFLFDMIFGFLKESPEDMEAENDDHDILSAYLMKNLVINTNNIQPIKIWLSLYDKLSKVSLSNEQKKRLDKQENEIKEILTNLTKILVAILGSRHDSFEPNIFSVEYCYKTLDLEIFYIDEKLQWKYDGDLSENDMRCRIIRELSSIGEVLVIYIYVMKYYRCNSKDGKLT